MGEVWGIGWQLSKWLVARGITNTLQLRNMDEEWFRKKAGVVGVRLVLELRGTPCLSLSLVIPPRKTITVSRSFGNDITTLTELREAIATYASRAAEKLRADGTVSGFLYVYVRTNQFATRAQYASSATIPLIPPTDSDIDLIRAAIQALERIYRDGYSYYKAGVILMDLTPAQSLQTDIFVPRDYDRFQRLNKAIDNVNSRFYSGLLHYAATGIRKSWKMKSQFRSPRYTTRWDEIPVVKAGRITSRSLRSPLPVGEREG